MQPHCVPPRAAPTPGMPHTRPMPGALAGHPAAQHGRHSWLQQPTSPRPRVAHHPGRGPRQDPGSDQILDLGRSRACCARVRPANGTGAALTCCPPPPRSALPAGACRPDLCEPAAPCCPVLPSPTPACPPGFSPGRPAHRWSWSTLACRRGGSCWRCRIASATPRRCTAWHATATGCAWWKPCWRRPAGAAVARACARARVRGLGGRG